MMLLRPVLIALLTSLAAAIPVQASLPLNNHPGQVYALADDSRYEEGCFAPCMCPVLLQEGLEGGFVLQPRGTEGGFEVFLVRNAKWITPGSFGGGPLRVYGGGVYRIDRAARLQRLELDLMLEGRGQEHFDSGLVPVTASFPEVSVAVSIHGFFCWDVAFFLEAKPQSRGDAPGLPTEIPGAQVLGAPEAATSWGTVKALYGTDG